MRLRHPSAGFTLVELSIVLVTIAFIVGAITVGRDLIRTAAQRTIIREQEGFKAALNVFRTKYNCLPGDCPNATQFWGANLTCGDATYRFTKRQATCNGNGDGSIASLTRSGENLMEMVYIWQHLANAGLIDGQYSGAPAGGYAQSTGAMGSNEPLSKVTLYGQRVGWRFINRDVTTWAWPLLHPTTYYWGMGFHFGRDGVVNTELGPTLPPNDAYAIDVKIDDGRPMTGQVTMSYWAHNWFPGCGRPWAGNPSAVENFYNLANNVTSGVCHAIFWINRT